MKTLRIIGRRGKGRVTETLMGVQMHGMRRHEMRDNIMQAKGSWGSVTGPKPGHHCNMLTLIWGNLMTSNTFKTHGAFIAHFLIPAVLHAGGMASLCQWTTARLGMTAAASCASLGLGSKQARLPRVAQLKGPGTAGASPHRQTWHHGVFLCCSESGSH
eukprot:1156797-Pelagomonas_calceolata.AAC.1